MVAASFITLAYWVAFAAVNVYLIWLIQVEVDRRRKVRRMRERRLRRRYLDSLEPRRWQP